VCNLLVLGFPNGGGTLYPGHVACVVVQQRLSLAVNGEVEEAKDAHFRQYERRSVKQLRRKGAGSPKNESLHRDGQVTFLSLLLRKTPYLSRSADLPIYQQH
jgi:hypothetical protein